MAIAVINISKCGHIVSRIYCKVWAYNQHAQLSIEYSGIRRGKGEILLPPPPPKGKKRKEKMRKRREKGENERKWRKMERKKGETKEKKRKRKRKRE